MDYIRETKDISAEEAIILWQASRLSLSKCYEKAPEILKVHGSVIGTLGNFSASIGKAKSKKTFNVSAIVAAALKNGTVLRYVAELSDGKRKVLYVDTEQSPYHCLKVMKRILRMADLPDDRDNESLEFLALRKYTPGQRIRIVEQAIYNTPDIGLVIIDGIRDMVYDINSPSESTHIISKLMQWTDERYCGFSDTKPWIPVSDNFEKINVKKQKQDRDSILEFYKKLIMLRKEKEVIARGNIEFMEVENAGVLAYTRCLDKQKLLVCCNFRDVESQMEFTQEWKSGRKILGNYEENHKNNYKVLTLRPYEIIVLEKGEE